MSSPVNVVFSINFIFPAALGCLDFSKTRTQVDTYSTKLRVFMSYSRRLQLEIVIL